MANSFNDAVAIAAMLALPGIGRRTVGKLLAHHRTVPNDFEEIIDWISTKTGKRGANINTSMVKKAIGDAHVINEKAEASSISVYPITHSAYPQSLREIDDPPLILYAKGNIQCAHSEHRVAIIGTRKPSKFGAEQAFSTAQYLGANGHVVISGLALGCDTVAHKGCIFSGAKTIAVLAHGLDMIHPKTNSGLARDIIEAGGALISEYPPGQQPEPSLFLDRNRIQSGLSIAIIVIETGQKGGTMHTVRFGRQQKKVIIVLAHNPDPTDGGDATGNQALLQDENIWAFKTQSDLSTLVEPLREGRKIRPHPNSNRAGAQETLWDDI